MPFFPILQKIEYGYFDYLIKMSKENVTLQVRAPLMKEHSICGKRVCLSSSGRETDIGCINRRVCWRRKIGYLKGSMSVEAALSMTLFLFAVVCMMIPMRMMDRQRQVQAAVEAMGENLSQYAYLGEADGSGLFQAGAGVIGTGQLRDQFNGEEMEQTSFWKSSILKDGETIDLVMTYKMKLPFSVLGLKGVSMENRSVRRAWIGIDGPLGNRSGETGAENEEETGKDTVVYVGRDSTRYHRTRDCHYLSNQLRAVSYDDLEEYRNTGGARYHACSVCGKNAGPGSTVYIMPSGESYHLDWNCSSIVSYVQEVPLSEVEHMGKCSYCW